MAISNVYTQLGGTGWEQTEGGRLRTMDEFFASGTTTADLGPVLEEVSTRRPDGEASLLDVGAGTGTSVEELCDRNGVAYYAYDINPAFLAGRTTPEERRILGDLNAEGAIAGRTFDATFSRAVMAWTVDPPAAIAKQLAASESLAVFSEYDWEHTAVDSPDTNVVAAGSGAIATVRSVLLQARFRPSFGAELGEQIDAAAQAAGLAYDRQETRHQPPADDYRAIFGEAVKTILDQLRAKMSSEGQSASVAKIQGVVGLLEGYMRIVLDAPEGAVSITLPALVTNVVRKRTVAQA